MINPIDNPELYDRFALDLIEVPGLTRIVGDGEREEEWQDQQAPLTTGANTIFRYELNGKVTYEIVLWERVHFDRWAPFVAMLNEGKARRPRPRIYVLDDRRLDDTEILTAGFAKLGPRLTMGRGGPWAHRLTLKEVRTQKQQGGAAQQPKNAVEQAIEDLSKENNTLNKQLAAAAAAARAGK